MNRHPLADDFVKKKTRERHIGFADTHRLPLVATNDVYF